MERDVIAHIFRWTACSELGNWKTSKPWPGVEWGQDAKTGLAWLGGHRKLGDVER